MDQWDDWIGFDEQQSDHIDPAMAARWLATFDLPLSRNKAMPQGFHFCLCTPENPTNTLGEDGHPQRDGSAESFFPPIPLPRRMWASSAIRFHAALEIGAKIGRRSRIISIKEKEGGSGKLAFVEVERLTHTDGALAVEEVQTLVYREAAPADAPLSPPDSNGASFDPSGWDAHREITPDPRLLFRYSALTFNTHRIHYDAPYARDVERYRGLVVHGPLMASLLLQLAARELGNNRLQRFAFRGVSPAISSEPLHLVMRQVDEDYELGAFAADGRQVMKASASV